MSLGMTKAEREDFLADVHVGIISITEGDRGPLTVPIWYAYDPGGELHFVTERTSRKGRLLEQVARFSLCAQTDAPPYKYVSVEGPIVAIETADVGDVLADQLPLQVDRVRRDNHAFVVALCVRSGRQQVRE